MTQDLIPDQKDFFTHTNSQGLLEVVDAVTGQVIAVQNDWNENVVLGKRDGYKTIMVEGEQVIVPTGMSVDNYKPGKHKYNKVIGDIIAQKIMEGETLTKICKRPGYPNYSTVSRWRAQHEEFDKLYNQAKIARAEAMHDKAMEELDDVESMTKDELAAAKLKIDTFKWSASVNDAKTFGNKKDDNQIGGGAIQIVVNTGIVRDSDIIEIDPQVKEVIETMDIGDKDESK